MFSDNFTYLENKKKKQNTQNKQTYTKRVKGQQDGFLKAT